MIRAAVAALLALGVTTGLSAAPTCTIPADTSAFLAVLAAEDRRAAGHGDLATIVGALDHDDPGMRVFAARALGRLERVDQLPALQALLADPHADVRAEAANAVGQSAFPGPPEAALPMLLERLQRESDDGVLGVVAQTLGRLPCEADPCFAAVEDALVRATAQVGPAGIPDVARGWASFARRTRDRHTLSPEGRTALVELAGRAGDTDADLRVRRLALAAAVHAGAASGVLLPAAQDDTDWQVRRVAVVGARSLPGLDSRAALVQRALEDTHFSVRLEGLDAATEHLSSAQTCAALRIAVDDPSPHVALRAIDLLAAHCGGAAAAQLVRLVDGPTSRLDWHRSAHALVALAHTNPEAARPRVASMAGSGNPWLRLSAARAATTMADADLLGHLAADDDANVREAATAGLQKVAGHAADALYLASLASDDYQLLITVAGALAGSDHPEALPRLLESLDRVTAAARETSRDTRRALLERIGGRGEAAQTNRLRPYLHDFDPVIARAAAGILTRWTGGVHTPAPRPLPRAPMPTVAELRQLLHARLVLRMRRGGDIVVQLHPLEAPTSVARFVRLARQGYFKGLTFHRVVPNWVIQGGSPGANEYMGAGPYTRDEVGRRSHTRGSVGISTRGRDTGDGQIFVDLLDNDRLDHNYTIVGTVVAGMDVVDAVLEGDVIESVELRQG